MKRGKDEEVGWKIIVDLKTGKVCQMWGGEKSPAMVGRAEDAVKILTEKIEAYHNRPDTIE